jgi:hypothetical protein
LRDKVEYSGAASPSQAEERSMRTRSVILVLGTLWSAWACGSAEDETGFFD